MIRAVLLIPIVHLVRLGYFIPTELLSLYRAEWPNVTAFCLMSRN